MDSTQTPYLSSVGNGEDYLLQLSRGCWTTEQEQVARRRLEELRAIDAAPPLASNFEIRHAVSISLGLLSLALGLLALRRDIRLAVPAIASTIAGPLMLYVWPPSAPLKPSEPSVEIKLAERAHQVAIEQVSYTYQNVGDHLIAREAVIAAKITSLYQQRFGLPKPVQDPKQPFTTEERWFIESRPWEMCYNSEFREERRQAIAISRLDSQQFPLELQPSLIKLQHVVSHYLHIALDKEISTGQLLHVPIATKTSVVTL